MSFFYVIIVHNGKNNCHFIEIQLLRVRNTNNKEDEIMKRFFSMLLIAAMVLSLMPLSALAQTNDFESEIWVAATVEDWQVVLCDDIGLNFRVQADSDSAVIVTVGDSVTTVELANLSQDEQGYYMISAHVAAAQMTDTVNLTIKNNEHIDFTKDYSVRQYADYILDPANGFSAKTQELVKQMLHYGAAAQTYFDYNTDNLANSGIKASKPAAVQTGPMSIEGSADGVSFYGATLLMQSKIAVRYYFTAADAAAIEACTFTVNDKTYSPATKDGKYYVDVVGINPQDLDESIELVVSAGTDSLCVKYGPMNYIERISEKGSENMKALVNALLGYYQAAEAYLAPAYSISFAADTTEESTFLYDEYLTGTMADDEGALRFIDGVDAYMIYGIDAGSAISNANVTLKLGQQYQKVEFSFDGMNWVTALEVLNDGPIARTFQLTSMNGFTGNDGRIYVRLSGGDNYSGAFGITFYSLSLSYDLVDTTKYADPKGISYSEPVVNGVRFSFKPTTAEETTYLYQDQFSGTDTGRQVRWTDNGSYFTYLFSLDSLITSARLSVIIENEAKIEASFDGASWVTVADAVAENVNGSGNYYSNVTNVFDIPVSGNMGALYIRFSDADTTDGFGGCLYDFQLDVSKGAALSNSTVSFRPTTADEASYLYQEQFSGTDSGRQVRWTDQEAFYVYKFSFGANILSADLSLIIENEAKVEASFDGSTWVTVADSVAENANGCGRYFGNITNYFSIPVSKNVGELYLKFSDSKTSDGFGGCLYDFKLDVTTGAKITLLNETISFVPTTDGETAYLDAEYATGTDTAAGKRWTDGEAFFVYKFSLGSEITAAELSLYISNQAKLEVSFDNESWTEFANSITENANGAGKYYDNIANNFSIPISQNNGVIYIRFSDADPSDGFGGGLINFAIELDAIA